MNANFWFEYTFLSNALSLVILQLITTMYNLTDGVVKNRGIVAKKQDGKRLWVCEICKKELKSRKKYNGHVKAHDKSTVHKCDICKKVLSTKSNLEKHKKIHSGVKDYKGGTCGEALHLKDHLERHQLRHTNVKLYKCNICPDNRSFNTMAELKEHVKYHYASNRVCKICDKKFHISSGLSDHRTSHRDEKPSWFFKTKKQLKKHYRNYHRNPQRIVKEKNSGKRVCGICKMELSSRSGYRQHVKAHEKCLQNM